MENVTYLLQSSYQVSQI